MALGGCATVSPPGGATAADGTTWTSDASRTHKDALNAWQDLKGLGFVECPLGTRKDLFPGRFQQARDRALAECDRQADSPMLPTAAMDELVDRFVDIIIAFASDPQFHDPTSRIGLHFSRFQGGGFCESALRHLHRSLVAALSEHPEIQEHFYIVAYDIAEAERLLTGVAGEEIIDPLGDGENPQAVARIPWDRFIDAEVLWMHFVTPSRHPTSYLPRLDVGVSAVFRRVATRPTIAVRNFSMVFVYHPNLGWISESYNESLRTARARG